MGMFRAGKSNLFDIGGIFCHTGIYFMNSPLSSTVLLAWDE